MSISIELVDGTEHGLGINNAQTSGSTGSPLLSERTSNNKNESAALAGTKTRKVNSDTDTSMTYRTVEKKRGAAEVEGEFSVAQ